MRVPKKLMMMMGAGGAVIPWYLAGGIALANCRAAYQPIGADDLADSYINLANPGTNDAAPGTAPTWDAVNGWTFAAASSQYLDSGIIAALNCTYSMIIRYTDHTTGYIIGNIATIGDHYICIAGGMTAGNGNWAGGVASNLPDMASGIYAVAGKTPYRNGAAEANLIPAGNGANANMTILIGARRLNGPITIDEFANVKVQAVAIYNTVITAPQVAAVTTRMAALP